MFRIVFALLVLGSPAAARWSYDYDCAWTTKGSASLKDSAAETLGSSGLWGVITDADDKSQRRDDLDGGWPRSVSSVLTFDDGPARRARVDSRRAGSKHCVKADDLRRRQDGCWLSQADQEMDQCGHTISSHTSWHTRGMVMPDEKKISLNRERLRRSQRRRWQTHRAFSGFSRSPGVPRLQRLSREPQHQRLGNNVISGDADARGQLRRASTRRVSAGFIRSGKASCFSTTSRRSTAEAMDRLAHRA